MRALRIGLWSLLGLVVLVVVGVGIAVATFNPDRFKPEIIAAAQRATGRELTLQGAIHLGFSLQPTLTVEGVSLANPPGFSRPQMATVKELDLKLALWPLLSKRVEITRLDLMQPDILLERNAKGQPNWQFTPAPGATPTQSGPATTTTPTGEKTTTQINVADLSVESGTVTWRDDASGQSAVIDLKTLEVGAPSPADNMHLAVTAAYNGNPFTLAGDVGPLAQLHGAAAAAAWPVRLDVAAAGAKLALAGSIAQPEQMHGYTVKITANVPDLAALQPFVPHAVLPPLHDIEFAAQVADTGAAAAGDFRRHAACRGIGPEQRGGRTEDRQARRHRAQGGSAGARRDAGQLRGCAGDAERLRRYSAVADVGRKARRHRADRLDGAGAGIEPGGEGHGRAGAGWASDH